VAVAIDAMAQPFDRQSQIIANKQAIRLKMTAVFAVA